MPLHVSVYVREREREERERERGLKSPSKAEHVNPTVVLLELVFFTFVIVTPCLCSSPS